MISPFFQSFSPHLRRPRGFSYTDYVADLVLSGMQEGSLDDGKGRVRHDQLLSM